MAAIVIAAVAAIAIGYGIWDRYPRPDALASVDKLVEQFDRAVFRGDRKNEVTEQLRLWSGWVRVRIVGDANNRWRPVVERHVATFTELTGLPFLVYILPGTTENFFIYLVDRGHAWDIVQRHIPYPGQYEEMARESACMFLYSFDRGRIKRTKEGLIIISPEALEGDEVSSCILTGIAGVLGLENESDLIRPSILSGRQHEMGRLSINDRILIRTLYDPRLRSGMPRTQALRIARKVITELHAKVLAGKPITVTAD